MRYVRIVVVAAVVEVLAILLLVLLVATLGPSDPAAAQAYAGRLGYWVGPIAGFALCIAGGWWVAKRLASHRILNGLMLGCAVAAIDVALLVAGGAEFDPVFAVSNLGRMIGGSLGGWLASPPRDGAA